MTHPDITIDEMSRPCYHAWFACSAIWDKLRPPEKDVVKFFHSSRDTPSLEAYADKHGLSVEYCWKTIKGSWRMWAVERGLADDE